MDITRKIAVASALGISSVVGLSYWAPATATDSTQLYLNAFQILPGLDPQEGAVSAAAGAGDAAALAAVDGNETQATTAGNSVAAARQQTGAIIGPQASRTATGDTDGNRISASASAGYQFSRQALTYGPYSQVNFVYADVDGFTESGAGNFNLVVKDEEVRSFTSVFGVRADYAISTFWGVISPSVRAEWEHEFSNDSRTVVTAFSANPNGLINVQTKAPDRNYFNVGAGVSATLPRGITAFADFEILLAHKDLDNHTITVGARMEF